MTLKELYENALSDYKAFKENSGETFEYSSRFDIIDALKVARLESIHNMDGNIKYYDTLISLVINS